MNQVKPVTAFITDNRGLVEDVLVDGLSLLEGLAPGEPFLALVDAGSRAKWLAFLGRCGDASGAYGWEVHLRAEVGHGTVHLAGAAVDGRIVVAVGAENHALAILLADLTDLDDQYLRQLRDVVQRSWSESPPARVWEDVTALNDELTNLQREMARQNRRMREALEERNRVMGMLAHDLRNPLQTLTMSCEGLLRAEHPLPEKVSKRLTAMRSSIAFMSGLVNDALDYATIESGQVKLRVKSFDLMKLIAEVAELQGLLAKEKQIEIRVIGPERLDVSLDRGKIEQVLVNLLSNAVKFSPSGRKVSVEVREPGDGESGTLRIEVCDEGPGIAEDHIDTLFEPFGVAGASSTGGEKSTGLGLAIVARIVRAHRGRVSVESGPGEGASFFVDLPRRLDPT